MRVEYLNSTSSLYRLGRGMRIMPRSLLQKYRAQIDAIRPPDELDCRTLLTGRTMHFIAESGIAFTREEIDELTREAMHEQLVMDSRQDRRERRRPNRYFRA